MPRCLAWPTALVALMPLALGLSLVPVRMAAAAELPWVDYYEASGCPSREVFEWELLNRSIPLPSPGQERLLVQIQANGALYEGRVRLSGTAPTDERLVSHQSCSQVVHALALISVVLLEANAPLNPAPQSQPQNKPPQTAPLPKGPSEGETVTMPRAASETAAAQSARPIRGFTFGPFVALTSDGLATPGIVNLGPRAGAVLTLHGMVPKGQESLRLSVANIQSGEIKDTVWQDRTATISWTSVRLDACHSLGAHVLSTVGACALFELGQLHGTGTVAQDEYHRRQLWARFGASIQLRQRIVGGLTFDASLGVVAPSSRPEFYFAATPSAQRQTVFQSWYLGPVADVGLSMHFW